MVLDRLLADVKCTRDLGSIVSLCQQASDFDLSFGQTARRSRSDEAPSQAVRDRCDQCLITAPIELPIDERMHLAQHCCLVLLLTLQLDQAGIGICNGQDTAMKGDLFTAELPVIALTIHPLMMGRCRWRQVL